MLSCVLIAPVVGKAPVTYSYVHSTCCLFSAVVVSCSFKALISAFPLIKIIVVTVVETTRLTTRATARKLMDIVDDWLTHVCVSGFVEEVNCTEMGLLIFPVIFPQRWDTVCTANVHMFPVGTNTSVHVTLVWLVVVGQLPQFDDRML